MVSNVHANAIIEEGEVAGAEEDTGVSMYLDLFTYRVTVNHLVRLIQ